MPTPQKRVMGNMFGREDSIKSLKCISPKADGCGRDISELEFDAWNHLTKKEYVQSGWCLECQNRIFADPEETEPSCSCEWIDVLGPGYPMMPREDPYCDVHGDPDLFRNNFDDYDPDMREDDPPHDITDIVWPVGVL